jgi:hypothetical protein
VMAPQGQDWSKDLAISHGLPPPWMSRRVMSRPTP